jgi:hypothetical protein
MDESMQVLVGCDPEGDYCFYIRKLPDNSYLGEQEMKRLAPAFEEFLSRYYDGENRRDTEHRD